MIFLWNFMRPKMHAKLSVKIYHVLKNSICLDGEHTAGLAQILL